MTFIPHVDAEGNLSWTNDGDLPNPSIVNIMGPQGPAGSGGSGEGVELDTTLTQAGKAADAKATGDVISELADNVAYVSDDSVEASALLDADKLGGIEADKYALISYVDEVAAELDVVGKKAHTPFNLLDNSYFVKPINQRGQTNCTGYTYTIDRWFLWSDNGTGSLTIEDNKITLNPNTATILTLAQKFPKGHFKANKYTLAYCFNENEIYINNEPIIRIDDVEYIEISASELKTIKWVALYEGEYTVDTLPEYVYKGYAAELAECLRYYAFAGRFYSIAQSKYQLYNSSCRAPLPMRIKPTVKLVSPSTNTENTIHHSGVGDITGFTATVDSLMSCVVGSPTGAFTAGAEYTWLAYFSADL